ncbi:MAG: Gfo/Idh/MocA family oxidoreductase [Tepidisphaeraceae bacterium]|jgi:predicted dehydrogenase
MKRIHWGIVGCGDVTEVKSGPAFQKATGSALTAVMRRDAAKAADYARRHGVPKWYSDAAKLIADPQVDAVYVATPPAMHETYALMVCAAGKPCYVEKPMARNTAEAQRMVDAFAVRGLPLFVAYYRRAQPRFVRAKKIIHSGVLGTIKTASYAYIDSQMNMRSDPVPWRFLAEQAGGGLLFDLGSHALDLMDFFLGPLGDVAGEARNIGKQYDVEDSVKLAFTARGKVKGWAELQFNGRRRDDRFKFDGENGSLQFSCFGTEPLVLKVYGWRQKSFEFPPLQHVQQPLIQSIVEALQPGAHVPDWLSTGAVALRTQRVMDQAVEGYYGGREDGFWSRPLKK